MSPVGLGVREVVLLMVLEPVVACSGAVAAAVPLSRMVHTLGDEGWALVGIALRAPRRTDTADEPHAVLR